MTGCTTVRMSDGISGPDVPIERLLSPVYKCTMFIMRAANQTLAEVKPCGMPIYDGI